MKLYFSIISVSAITSIGLNITQTASSVRAGISRVKEIQEIDWRGKDGKPYRGGFLPTDCLEPLHRKTYNITRSSISARLIRLGAAALQDFYPLLSDLEIIPSIIVGIANQEQLPNNSSDLFIDNLMRQAQIRLNTKDSKVVIAGRASGLLAIHEACLKLSQGHSEPIIVGGIDSYFDFSRLVDLDFDGRILNSINLDGFLPGEGAGFILLTRSDNIQEPNKTLSKIIATSTGFEKGHLYSDEPMLGNGLSRTVQNLFQTVPENYLPCNTVYSNLNGESISVKEWGVCYIRNKKYFSENCTFFHPAEYMGDAGAAMGPIMIGLATNGIKYGDQIAPFLIYCSSDAGERAAIILN